MYTERLPIQVTPTMKAELEQLAEKRDLPVSVIVREWIAVELKRKDDG